MNQQQRLAMGVKRDHVAIMRKSWGLTQRLLTGEKTIESRWYKNRYAPWNQIFPGDRVYFKDSGELVTVSATVRKVEQYADLTSKRVIALLHKYAQADGLGIDKGSLRKFYYLFKDKKYCIIVFLTKTVQIEPFEIDKKGFGAQASWLVVNNIDKIKI